MIMILQLALYCLLFTAMVRYAVKGGAIDGLYFYPKPVQERAIDIGLIDRETMRHKRKVFMTEFVIAMLAALVLIIGLWNHVSDLKTAYLQALLFLEVMNWYDGIIIDKVWVGTSRFWILPGCEDIPYVQTAAGIEETRYFDADLDRRSSDRGRDRRAIILTLGGKDGSSYDNRSASLRETGAYMAERTVRRGAGEVHLETDRRKL